MKFHKKLAVFAFIFLVLLGGCEAPNSDSNVSSENPPARDTEIQNYEEFFAEEKVHDLYVELDDEDWQAILEAPEEKEYYTADVTIDGRTLENTGFRTRGNSSLRMSRRHRSERYPFRIKFDEYVNDQTFLGLDELVLNNSTDDPSYLREYLGYEAFRQIGMDVPYVTFFHIYINGELHGFYVGVEAVDNSYLDRTFGSHGGNLYKAEEDSTLESDMDMDLLEQKKGDDTDRSDLAELIRILDETETGEKGGIETILEVNSVLQYFAGNAVLHNWDDYAGQFAHNYYFYMDSGRFSMIPWDMNEGFLQTQAYYRESDGARQDISIPITGEATLENRPLVEKLLAVPEYYRQYLEYCSILAEWLEEISGNQLTELKERVQASAEQDPTKFYSYSEFEEQFSNSNSYGLAGFIQERAEYIKGQLDD